MKTFNNNSAIKADTIVRLEAHRAADEIVKGHYWHNGTGCAVGCLTRDPEGGHDKFPDLFGMPEWFAYWQDRVFEGLPAGLAKEWPVRVMSAVPVGVELGDQFRHMLLADMFERVVLPNRARWGTNEQQVTDAVQGVITALRTGENLEAARSAAWSAAKSAEEYAAWSAAWSTAWSAEEYAAESSARSAAWSAAESSTRSATWVDIADLTIEHLEALNTRSEETP